MLVSIPFLRSISTAWRLLYDSLHCLLSLPLVPLHNEAKAFAAVYPMRSLRVAIVAKVLVVNSRYDDLVERSRRNGRVHVNIPRRLCFCGILPFLLGTARASPRGSYVRVWNPIQ